MTVLFRGCYPGPRICQASGGTFLPPRRQIFCLSPAACPPSPCKTFLYQQQLSLWTVISEGYERQELRSGRWNPPASFESDAPSRICIDTNTISAMTCPRPPPWTRSQSHPWPKKDTQFHKSEGFFPLTSHSLIATSNNFQILPPFLPCKLNSLVEWTHIGGWDIASEIEGLCALGGFSLASKAIL